MSEDDLNPDEHEDVYEEEEDDELLVRLRNSIAILDNLAKTEKRPSH